MWTHYIICSDIDVFTICLGENVIMISVEIAFQQQTRNNLNFNF